MKLTIYNNDGKSFEIAFSRCPRENKDSVWVSSGDGEGGAFSADHFCEHLYNAIDQYFKENH